MMWLMLNAGNCLEADYPWTGEVGTCVYDIEKAVAGLGSVSSGYEIDEEEMKDMVYGSGPSGVAMNGEQLQFYTGGIIDLTPEECDTQSKFFFFNSFHSFFDVFTYGIKSNYIIFFKFNIFKFVYFCDSSRISAKS